MVDFHDSPTEAAFRAEVRAFIAAGFTPDQYELVVDSISRGRARATMRRSRR